MAKTRVWTSVLIAALAVIVVVWSAPQYPFQSKGIFLPAKITKQSAIPVDNVKLYNNFPGDYKVLGVIRIELHSRGVSKKTELEVIQKAKQLAAQNGANGVVIKLFFHTLPGQVQTALASYSFTGVAINTPTDASGGVL